MPVKYDPFTEFWLDRLRQFDTGPDPRATAIEKFMQEQGDKSRMWTMDPELGNHLIQRDPRREFELYSHFNDDGTVNVSPNPPLQMSPEEKRQADEEMVLDPTDEQIFQGLQEQMNKQRMR